MSLQPVLIAGEWQKPQNPAKTFTATNPAAKSPLPDQYPVSGLEEVERALQAAQEAVVALRDCTPEDIARTLRRVLEDMMADGTKTLPALTPISEFVVRINVEVAGRLGLAFPPAGSWIVRGNRR